MASVVKQSHRLSLSVIDTATSAVSVAHLAVNAAHDRAVVWHNQNARDCAALERRSFNTTLHHHVTEAVQELEELHELLYPGTPFDRVATTAKMVAEMSAAISAARLA
jgi:hypothetical protein